ncbi:hypothetical protein J0910_14455 [Nocardiopsis sp. CNT-189]|uniref:hypothetical protein n=1 Tax=Nocardiopsis oceanisediminis TaxID=2816862 RepID=UPI003B37A793
MNGAYSPVPELNALREFEDGLGGGFFSPGFELFEYGKDVDWFCGDAPDAYLDRLIPFAYATSSGSYYALWRLDDRTDLAALPVVFFGDEGDLRIEACGLRELFRLLGAEPEDPEDRARLAPARREYLAWLDRAFGLAPLGGADDVDGAALEEHTRRFAEWVAEFASEDLLDHVLDALGLEPPAP